MSKNTRRIHDSRLEELASKPWAIGFHRPEWLAKEMTFYRTDIDIMCQPDLVIKDTDGLHVVEYKVNDNNREVAYEQLARDYEVLWFHFNEHPRLYFAYGRYDIEGVNYNDIREL